MKSVKHLYIIFLAIFMTLNISCSSGGDDIDLTGTDKSSENVVAEDDQGSSTTQTIVLSSGDTNNGGFFAYNTDGTFIKTFMNLRSYDLSTPTAAQGIAIGSKDFFVSSLNGSDALLSVEAASTEESDDFDLFYGSSSLNGNIYDIEKNETNGLYYVVESNNIEVISSDGIRVSAARINQNLGGCSLNSPRNLEISNGFLYVANYNSSEILKYDISGVTPICENTYSVGVRPYGLVKHSSGLIYFTSYTTDAVYTLDEDTSIATEIFRPGTTILDEPKGIVEVEDGNLLVSASRNDTIEKINALGERQGFEPFIIDSNSLNITDIEVLELELN